LAREERVTVKEYKQIVDGGEEHLLLDVREKAQFDICALDWSYRTLV
jgi:hypothetical protein